MVETPQQDGLSQGFALSSPPSISPTTRAAAVLAMLDSAAMQQGAAPVGMMTVEDATADDIGAGALPPYLVFAGSDAGSSFASASGGRTQSGFDAGGGSSEAGAIGTMNSAGGGVAYGGVGTWAPPNSPGSTTTVTATGALPPMPMGVATAVPDARHVEVEGSLDPAEAYLTVQIPVGPTTHELGLSLRGVPGSDGSQPPMLGQMSLVDRNGDTLAHLGPLWGDGGSSDAVTLAFNDVPAGGTLLVQVSTPTGFSPSGASALSGSSVASGSGWTLPFLMDVQRVESPAAAATGGAGSLVGAITSTGWGALGTLPGSWGSQGQAWTANGATSNTQVSTTVSAAVVDPGEPGLTGEGASIDETLPAEFGARLATGPLAARAAAPIGPNLSTVMLDPVPAIDRHERALSQEIADNDVDDGPQSREPSIVSGDPDLDPEGAGNGNGPEDREPPGANVVSIAGLGPLRGKVSRLGGGRRRGDLGALHAALSQTMGGDDQLAGVVDDAEAGDALLVAMAAPGAVDAGRRPAPDYVTSACILAIGMGLVTGPIIPDLLRLIPSRSSRWRGGGRGPSLESAAGSGHRGFGHWLRGRLGT